MSEPRWTTWARAALRRGTDCPDEETLRTWSERPQGPGDPVGDHVARCARCRFEAAEIRAFLAEGVEPGPEARQLESTLRDVLALHGARGSTARRTRSFRWLPLTAAVIVVASALALLLRDRAPAIPGLSRGPGALRGVAAPRPVEPAGPVPAVPLRLDWSAAAGDEGPWDVRLETVDGKLLWSSSASDSRLELPAEARALLEPGSRYVWRVGKTGPGAVAAAETFWIVPSGEDPAGASD